MTELVVEKFEPVHLEIGECKITDHGKRWRETRMHECERFGATVLDILKLAKAELWKWPLIQHRLNAEGVPQNVSGISQYAMPKLIDHLNGKTAFTMPVAVAMALDTAAPTSTSTGASQAETTYTGYGRQTLAGAAFVAATAATPSVALNSGTITFANCTGTGATLLGFTLDDSAAAGAGNVLWFGSLTSTVISTTQTPPTIAASALSLSMNTT